MKAFARHSAFLVLLSLLLAPLAVSHAASTNMVVVADRFGRQVNDVGITLVDWEGHLANPAIQYTVNAPDGAVFTRVKLSASDQRLYFNLPSKAGANGPEKVLELGGVSSVEFHMSVFPDRDGLDEMHSLTIEYLDAKKIRHTQTLDIHVIDQDRPSRGLSYNMTVDFSYDETGLFDDPGARKDVTHAAQDWVYFFDGRGLDEVPAGQEPSQIWDAVEGWPTGQTVYNKESYTGFLLYAYGNFVGTGGGPSWEGAYQSANGKKLPLKRSGDIEMQKSGNWGTDLGWDTGVPDEKWWSLSTLDGAHDFYSIALHEIGHALIFNPGYPKLQEFMELGYINSKKVRDYYAAFVPKYLNDDIDRSFHGEYIPINVKKDGDDHLPLGIIDTISRRNGWFGEMPHGRELVTKGELLIAQAIGYTLRETSPFIPLSITDQPLPEGTSGAPYSYTATVSGGTPAYHWKIESGTLPKGLSINSFTGTISGTPRQHGTFNVTLSVSDYDETTSSVTRAVTLIIREGEADADSDGDLTDAEPSGEDQQESEEQPTSTVELDGISSSHNSVRENDGQTTITLTVTLDKAAATNQTITLAIVTPTEGKTAKRGEDFDATLDGTITISAGQTKGTAQLTLTPRDNATADGPKAFGVQATSSSGHQALINIKIDDDEMDDSETEEDDEKEEGEDSEIAFAFADEVADQAYTAGTAIRALQLPEAVGGEGEVTYRVSNLPAGLTFDAATQTMAGTPAAATEGAVEVTYTARDSTGATTTLTFSITVNPPLSFGDLFGRSNSGADKIIPTASPDRAAIHEFVVGQHVEGLTLPADTTCRWGCISTACGSVASSSQSRCCCSSNTCCTTS